MRAWPTTRTSPRAGHRLLLFTTLSRLFPSLLLSALLLAPTSPGRADMIPMRDFIRLKNGMSEAEVLYRVGTPDHESLYMDYHHNVLRKVWYYIPARTASNAWITEITFDHAGVVQSLQRDRARR